MQRLTQVTCAACDTSFIMRDDEVDDEDLCCPRCGNVAVPDDDDEEDEDDE